MPRKAADPRHWATGLRKLIKNQYGSFWGVEEQGGKVKLVYRSRFEGAPLRRSAATLDLPWSSASTTEVLKAIEKYERRMDETGLTLAELHKFAGSTKKLIQGQIDWPALQKRFLENLATELRGSTISHYRTTTKRFLELINGTKPPASGQEAERQYVEQFQADLAPGSGGRRRGIKDLGRFLKWAVEREGAPRIWLPSPSEKQAELIGYADASRTKIKPPIKEHQLSWLLDELERTGEKELRLAIGLVGLFGLRPAELAAMRMEENGDLWIQKIKRNRADMRRSAVDQQRHGERLVISIDIPDRIGLGQELAEQWAEKKTRLPKSIQFQIDRKGQHGFDYEDVGQAF